MPSSTVNRTQDGLFFHVPPSAPPYPRTAGGIYISTLLGGCSIISSADEHQVQPCTVAGVSHAIHQNNNGPGNCGIEGHGIASCTQHLPEYSYAYISGAIVVVVG